MSKKSIIIIGGGISGLSTGCYGQMNNYETQIFEKNSYTGGVCAAWKRKEYLFDGCIHWLVGAGKESSVYQVWKELGIIKNQRMIYHKEYIRVEDENKDFFKIPTDINHLEEHLINFAPEDERLIKMFIKDIRACLKLNLPLANAFELFSLWDNMKLGLHLFSFLRILLKWGNTSIKEFAQKFKNPLLREGLPFIWFPEYPVLFIIVNLAWMHKKTAGYPQGGSYEFSHTIEKRYKDLGGKINYRCRVSKILVKNNKAVGVRLENGKEFYADYIISGSDGYSTIFKMLEKKYINRRINGYFKDLPLFPPLIHMCLGVKNEFKEFPPSYMGLCFPLEKPVNIAGKKRKRLNIHINNFESNSAPSGHSTMKVLLDTDFSYWKSLYKDRLKYKAEKKRVAEQIIQCLNIRFPHIKKQIKTIDVATPMTFYRYTDCFKASFEGWFFTTKTWTLRMKKTLPGLKNFYMVGQWIFPGGGLPPAAFTGRHIVQILCRKDKKRFKTSIPS